jgi:hypothetical protein
VDNTLVDVADTVVVVLLVDSAAVGAAVGMRVADLASDDTTVVALVVDGLVLMDDGLVDRGDDGLDEDGLVDLDDLGDVGDNLHVPVLLVQRVDLNVLVVVVDGGDTDVLVVVVVVGVLGDWDGDGDLDWDVDHSRLGIVMISTAAAAPSSTATAAAAISAARGAIGRSWGSITGITGLGAVVSDGDAVADAAAAPGRPVVFLRSCLVAEGNCGKGQEPKKDQFTLHRRRLNNFFRVVTSSENFFLQKIDSPSCCLEQLLRR